MRCCATKIHFSFLLPALFIGAFLRECQYEQKKEYTHQVINLTYVKHHPLPARPNLASISCESRISSFSPVISTDLEEYDRNLPYLAIYTKTVPVQFLRKPQPTDNPTLRKIRNELSQQTNLIQYLRSLKKKYENNKKELREIFLSEGYFFDERPRIAHQMSKEIALTDLFFEKKIFRFRKNEIQTLTFENGDYIDESGDRALLLINDRVSIAPEKLTPLKHLDMEYVRAETGAVQTKLSVRFDRGAALVLLFPNGDSRPALVLNKNQKTYIECIGGDTSTLENTRQSAREFWKHHEKIVETVKRIVTERPRFDEPTDELEDVQEDGELRRAWKEAYRNRQKKFLYRDVEYDVFDRRGNPIPPQVCVDFIMDTWERSSGTWYAKRGETPTRAEGDIDFYALEGVSRRYISSLLYHATLEGSPFSRYDIPQRDWAPLERRRRYVRKLLKHANHYQEGDLLVIHGLREEDMQEHFHTVLILRTDPVTGLPVLIADNQGRPRITTLVQAMRAAPKRSVKYRLRLDFKKMAVLTDQFRKMKHAKNE